MKCIVCKKEGDSKLCSKECRDYFDDKMLGEEGEFTMSHNAGPDNLILTGDVEVDEEIKHYNMDMGEEYET